MFTIETEKYEMKVSFSHLFPADVCVAKPGTDCVIEIRNKNGTLLELTQGYTFLHDDDQYSRPFGRKLALARAIQSLIPRRFVRVRRMIWQEYFKTISPKRGAL